MATTMFDRLAYFDRLIKAGFAEDQARAATDALEQALREFRQAQRLSDNEEALRVLGPVR